MIKTFLGIWPIIKTSALSHVWGSTPDDAGERLNGIQEVSGSIPLISTNSNRLQGALCSLLLYYHLKFAGPCGKRANRIIRNPPEGGNGLSRSHKFYMSSKSLAASASPRPPNGCTSPSPHCPSRSSSWRTNWDIHCLSVPRGECG